MSILPKLRMLAIGMALAVSMPALGQMSRQVTVNGVLLNKAQLKVMDSLNCGAAVPNGIYWLKATGAWGYPGGGQEGILGEKCASSSKPPNSGTEKSE